MVPDRQRVVRIASQAVRERIIQAATRVFADQGYSGATIGEIARTAGLSDAALYEYFQGKEDLLLSVPDTWVEQAIHDLDEHLFGIEGAFNKLRKFLWWYLRYIERTTDNAKIVFLFLKTHQAFMDTPVYQKVRTFYGKLTDVIVEGQQRGEINPALPPVVARALVLGLIEHTVTRWLLHQRSYPLFEHVETMFAMIRSALEDPAKSGARPAE